MIRWEDFAADVERRKQARWADALASEPPGRTPGRRPRDPEKEKLLAELDRQRTIQGVEVRWPVREKDEAPGR